MSKTQYHEVKKKLKALQFQPKKSLGQNFLIGKETITKIIEKIKAVPSKKILEIGPGLGALTDSLQHITPFLKLIEMDQALFNYWKNKNFNVQNKNALELNLNEIDSNFILGNLPYSIASRLLVHLSIQETRKDYLLFMFQKEVGKRILSKKQNKNYGLLSVIAQTFWNIKWVTEASPSDFYPRPKVAGWVLFFERKKIHLKNPLLFLKLIQCAFSHRRKFLIKNLKLYLPFSDFKNSSETFLLHCRKILNDLDLNEKIRAEEVSPEKYIKILNRLNSLKNTESVLKTK